MRRLHPESIEPHLRGQFGIDWDVYASRSAHAVATAAAHRLVAIPVVRPTGARTAVSAVGSCKGLKVVEESVRLERWDSIRQAVHIKHSELL